MVEAGFDHDTLNAMPEAEFGFWLKQRAALVDRRERAARDAAAKKG